MRGKKQDKKGINNTLTKIEYGGVDLPEPHQIDDIYS